LHHLDGCSKNGSTKVALGVPQAATGVVGPAREITFVYDDLALELGIRNDFGEFNLDVLGVFRLTTENSQRSSGLLELATLHEITRRFREKE
jgi:hypothetical protein